MTHMIKMKLKFNRGDLVEVRRSHGAYSKTPVRATVRAIDIHFSPWGGTPYAVYSVRPLGKTHDIHVGEKIMTLVQRKYATAASMYTIARPFTAVLGAGV